ncbi:MAG TPA: phosphoenolpyruvate mutase [Cyanobacteria bacterium UBA8530]|nr:phosphoenolpyruvate mutase [Cyanobacteria bacterium UBA8530]
MLPLRNNLPEQRRGLLKKLLVSATGPLRILESHNGLSALIANDTAISSSSGTITSFDGIWISGLAETASRGLPDIELQGLTARLALCREVAMVTDKPMVVDGDTGGTIEQLQYHIRLLEGMGISGLIIEDKVFPKNNSLDMVKPQVLEDPDVFARKIAAGKQAQLSEDFLLIARIEALIAGKGMPEALMRAQKYLLAGADAIVIHSRSGRPDEVLEFARGYQELCRANQLDVPLVCIPTTYGSIKEEELFEAGFKLIIYANFLLRSAYLAMKETAEAILEHGRSLEAEPLCCPLPELFKCIEPAVRAVPKN